MSSSLSSTDSAYYEYTRHPPTQRRRSKLTKMDKELAGGGAWTQTSLSQSGKSHDHDTVSSARTEVFDEAFMSTGSWTYPANIPLVSTQDTTAIINVAQNAECIQATSYNDRVPSNEGGPAARQPAPTATAGLPQSNLMTNVVIHHWVPTPTGYRSDTPLVFQDDRRASRRQRPTRDHSTSSCNWVFLSFTSYDVDKDTCGVRTDVPLPSDASYSTWIDVDLVSEASFHRRA